MAERNEQQQKQWVKIVAKAWADEDYKQALINDPAAILTKEGMPLPDGVEIQIVEATDKKVWMVLPPKPSGDNIEEVVERLAAEG